MSAKQYELWATGRYLLLLWLLVLSGCNTRALESRNVSGGTTDPAASQELVSTWPIEVNGAADRLQQKRPSEIRWKQVFYLTQDLRWAAAAWHWVHGTPPSSLQQLRDARLLLLHFQDPSGQPVPVVELLPGATPQPDQLGVHFDADGFTVKALNPDLNHPRPVFELQRYWEKEFTGTPPYPPVTEDEARAAWLAQREAWLKGNALMGLPVPTAGGLAPEAGAGIYLWSARQFSERRVLAMESHFRGMLTAFLNSYGRFPADPRELCTTFGIAESSWQPWPADQLVPADVPAFAAQVNPAGDRLRILLKPTIPAAEEYLYSIEFDRAKGRVHQTLLIEGAESEAGWRDLLRVVLPGETDIPGQVGGSADLGSHPGASTTSQAGALTPAARGNGE